MSQQMVLRCLTSTKISKNDKKCKYLAIDIVKTAKYQQRYRSALGCSFSAFAQHGRKCLLLDSDNNDQCFSMGLRYKPMHITGKSGSLKGKEDQFKWLGNIGPYISKFQHIERVIFVGQIVMNVFLSCLVSGVLLNWLRSTILGGQIPASVQL